MPTYRKNPEMTPSVEGERGALSTTVSRISTCVSRTAIWAPPISQIGVCERVREIRVVYAECVGRRLR